MSILNELENDVVNCMKCGNCRENCPVFLETDDETIVARGKLRLIRAVIEGQLPITEKFRDKIQLCLNCDACKVTCPPGIATEKLISKAREAFLKAGFPLPESQAPIKKNITEQSNPFGQKASERGDWLPPELKSAKKSEYLFHAGCSISFASSRTGKAILRILQNVKDFDFTCLGAEELCCGDPLFRMGEADLAEEHIKKYTEKIKSLGVKTIFTSCAGCLKSFKKHYRDFQVKHITEVFDDMIKEGRLEFKKEFPKKVLYFDGCDIGRHSGIYEPPRNILKAIPKLTLCELPLNRENARCCGGPFIGSYPDMAKKLASNVVAAIKKVNPDIVAVACPTCLINLKEGANLIGEKLDIQDLIMLAHRSVA